MKQQTAKPEDELTPMQFDVVARLVSSRGQRDKVLCMTDGRAARRGRD